jgi:hypothetical protein
VKVRWTLVTSTHSDPPVRFSEPDENGMMVQVHPETGEHLTEEERQQLGQLRQSNRQTTRSIELWTQPWHRYVIAKLYDKYHWFIIKLPGFHAVENWLMKRHDRRSDDLALPLCALQDLRCFELSRKQRTEVCRLPLNEDAYEKLKKARNGENW